ncbi:hypothetical protein GCM10018780_71420 [Streptomyces lanatus]|nr:hypothetical protein GCM10018780_71420 [Streptomyces lanatus]
MVRRVSAGGGTGAAFTGRFYEGAGGGYWADLYSPPPPLPVPSPGAAAPGPPLRP